MNNQLADRIGETFLAHIAAHDCGGRPCKTRAIIGLRNEQFVHGCIGDSPPCGRALLFIRQLKVPDGSSD